MLSEHFHQLSNRDHLLTQSPVSRIFQFVKVGLCSILVEKEAKQSSVLLEDKPNAVLFSVFLSTLKVDENIFLAGSGRHRCGWVGRNEGYSSFLGAILGG